MNQRAWVPWSRTRCSAAACVGTTRMRPSAPIPARRSVRRRTSSAVTSREPSRSATSTKSFSVPWPLVKCSTPGSVISPIVAHPTAPRRVRPHRGYDVQRPVGHLRVVIPEPVDARIRSEPRLLPPGKPAGRRDRVLDGLLDTEEAIQVRQRLAVAESLRCRPTLSQTGRVQTAYLLEQACVPHLVNSSRNARIEIWPGDTQPNRDGGQLVLPVSYTHLRAHETDSYLV